MTKFNTEKYMTKQELQWLFRMLINESEQLYIMNFDGGIYDENKFSLPNEQQIVNLKRKISNLFETFDKK